MSPDGSRNAAGHASKGVPSRHEVHSPHGRFGHQFYRHLVAIPATWLPDLLSYDTFGNQVAEMSPDQAKKAAHEAKRPAIRTERSRPWVPTPENARKR